MAIQILICSVLPLGIFCLGLYIGLKIGKNITNNDFLEKRHKIEYLNGDDEKEYVEELKKKSEKGTLKKEDIIYHAQDDEQEFKEEQAKGIFDGK
jgi:hypothetical protein